MYRLVYKSRSASNIDWDMVKSILHTSEERNRRADITGILLATSTHFLQVLEGPYESVNETFMRIVGDERHEDLWLISFGVTDARLFEGWGMKGIGAFDFNRDMETNLIRKFGREDDGIKFPREEWKALALIHDINMISDPPSWRA